ncbi:MAG: M81 family metallopeptidase [Myxococcales bacterium]|nr:M81 family metallopeptidase [Myxococcales bacterium]
MRLISLPKLGRGGRPLRIAYGRIFHEANAYSPLVTGLDAFENDLFLAGDELARATTMKGSELAGYLPHAELTGFVQAANLAGGVETVPLASYMAVPSGPISREAFDKILDDQLARLRAAGPVDGVYLALHGSMEVQGLHEMPEALILRRVREVLGPEPRIAASFDLHANLSKGVVDQLDILVAYRTNPHWDLAPTGFRAGSRLIRLLRGEIKPVHAWRKLPLVLGGGNTIDFLAPMRGVFRWMKELENDPRVISASLFMVHPYTSADDLGWAAHVCTDGDEALANKLAEELAERAWNQRDEALPPMLSPAEALDQAKASAWRKLGPITFVDIDDIVGAGAPGGNTHIVRELARDDRGLKVFVAVHDPALLDLHWDTPIGTQIQATLRGTEGYNMPEVPLRATVAARATSDMGRKLRLDVGRSSIVIMERPPLPIHPKFWRDVGLEARDADVVVQKNFFHYRIFYATTSFQHLPVVSDGATSFGRVRARAYKTPVHPSAKIADWRAHDRELRL